MHSYSPIEILEDRIAPAGIVNVTLVAGKLTILGDAAANTITVTQSSLHAFTITGTDSTTISLNGATAFASVIVQNVTGDLVANLGDGADSLSLTGLHLPHNLTINDPLGPSTISMNDLLIGGNFSLTTGNSADSISAGGTVLSVGGNLLIRMGQGSNSLGLGSKSLHAGGAIVIVGGDDSDFVSVGPASLDASSVLLLTGKGSNGVGISADGVKIPGSLTVASTPDPAGTCSTSISLSGQIGGALAVLNSGGFSNGTGISGTGLLVGSLTVSGGLGSNSTSVSDVNVRGNLSVLHPASSAQSNGTSVSPGGVGGSVIITGGKDLDSVDVSLTHPVAGNVSLRLGGGENNASVKPSVLGGSILFDGHAGTKGGYGISGTNFRIGGGITVLAGTSATSLSLSGTSVEIGGPVLLQGGNASDTFSFTGTSELYLHQGVTASAGGGGGSLTLSGDLLILGGHLGVKGGAGDDVVTLSGKRIFLQGGASIAGGAGLNTNEFSGQDIAIQGALVCASLDQAAGTDANIISASNSLHAGSITFINGDGETFGEIAGTEVKLGGPLTVLAKGGSHSLLLFASDLSAPAGLTSVFGDGPGSVVISSANLRTGHLSTSFGKGSKLFEIFGSGSVGAITMNGLDGAATFQSSSTELQASSLSVHTAGKMADTASVALYNLGVSGATSLLLGDARSGVSIENLAARGAFILKTGASADDIEIEQGSSALPSFFGSVVGISTGAGADKVKIGGSAADRQAIFSGPVFLNGGADSDTIAINTLGNVFKGGKSIVGFETIT